MSTIAHAQHNKKACDFLLANSKFNDWVVTTAFYAAMHYVQSKIFPYTEGSRTFVDIDSYVTYINSIPGGRKISKHAAVKKLVNTKLPNVYTEYRKLFDTCMTARYSMYKVHKADAINAQAELLIIEKACTISAIKKP